MNAGDELRLRFPEAPPPAARAGPRLRRRRRRLGEGRRLQHDASRGPSCRCRRTPAAATTRRRGGSRTIPSIASTRTTSPEYHTRYVTLGRRPRRASRWRRTQPPAVRRDHDTATPGSPSSLYLRRAAARRRSSSAASASRPARPPPSGDADPLAQLRLPLTESAKAAGLDFVHEAPTLDPKLAHIMPQVASMGAAVSVVDFDRDGWPDLYVTNSEEGSRNRLFRNRGRRHVRRRRRAARRRRPQSARDRRLDGRGLGRLRQRRLRGSVPLSLGPPGALSQRRRAAASRA